MVPATGAPAGACLEPSAAYGADVVRNARKLAPDGGLCLSRMSVEEHGLTWTLSIIDNPRHPVGPTSYLLHDNEDTAYDAALYGVQRYGGRMIAIAGGDVRRVGGQDPNRNFGRTPSDTASCTGMRKRPAPIFTEALLALRVPGPDIVLALHNNADGHKGNGGSGIISARRASALLRGLRARGGADEDDAILLAGMQSIRRETATHRTAQALRDLGVNVIYELVIEGRNDCSLSHYTLLNGIAPYYNIEAQHGHLDQQIAMLDALMRVIGVSAARPD